ncbi:MAG: aliphatic sulfonate ABC transporter substrate-binding protein [Flavobacteriaceae bacterium]
MIQTNRRQLLAGIAGTALATALPIGRARAAGPDRLTVDYATYNPLSILIRENGWMEEEFAGTEIRWVQTLGSNKALEFLNAESIDIGSTAGAAALVGRINGNPVKSVGVYSKPEWTALVTLPGTGIEKVEDLKGRRVAVTRGTDPHIFLVRALADASLSEKDVQLVLLQHPDGKTALIRGDVEAWAGLDPMMAAAEIENDARLFYRNPDANSWGILNTTEKFAAAHPEAVQRVLKVYEKARQYALQNPAELASVFGKFVKLPDPIVARQLERTDLSNPAIGDKQKTTIVEAGKALQAAGVIKADVDVDAVAGDLIEPKYSAVAG